MTIEPNSTDQVDADVQPVEERARLAARRKFLKGTSLALPAVMTLTSGTAQAMGSLTTCGTRARDSNLAVPAVLIEGDDLYLRQSVEVFDQVIQVDDGTGGGGTIPQPNGIPTYFFDPEVSKWRTVSGAFVNPSTNPDLVPPTDRGPVAIAVRNAIVHIDAENGEQVAIGSPSNPPNAIITSAAGLCLASLTA